MGSGKKRWAIVRSLIFLSVLLALSSTLSQAVPGCCANPALSSSSSFCSDSNPIDSGACCPPFGSNPTFYYAPTVRQNYPQSQSDCTSNFFSSSSCSNLRTPTNNKCSFVCCCLPTGGVRQFNITCTSTSKPYSTGTNCADACPKTECADGIDNDGNGCSDLSDSGCINAQDMDEDGGVCSIQTPGGCSDPSHTPTFSTFSVIPNRGQKSFKLDWTIDCDANGFEVWRCEGNNCATFERIATTFSAPFIDADNSLLFEKNYTYKVVAKYSGRTGEISSQAVRSLGNLECFGHTDNAQFCVQEGTYFSLRDLVAQHFTIDEEDPMDPGEVTSDWLKNTANPLSRKLQQGYTCDADNVRMHREFRHRWLHCARELPPLHNENRMPRDTNDHFHSKILLL
jgi:hypothetical protein